MSIELEFSYDISGHDNVEVNLYSYQQLETLVNAHIYTQNAGPLAFSYDIAGHQNEQCEIHSTTQLESSKQWHIELTNEINCVTQLELSRSWNIGLTTNHYSETLQEMSHILNLGYADDIMFGQVILRYAKYDDIDEIDFPFREKRLYGGYRSIRSKNVRGYSGSFVAETDDYNDIQALIDLIGTAKTLRIWGKPYRNCYIKPPIRIKTVKKGVNRWIYWVSIYQDSAITEVSA